ncbi:MAG: DUF3068 domain-containing protein [Longispora sp.]|nr:DUF3068 domain-containing protein [Longispora sp. (in: high G+C Gram-positive bacteria)]
MEQVADSPTRTTNRWAIPLAIVGVLLLAAAAILYWVIVPNNKQLPSDTNVTRMYDGSAKVILNSRALAAGDLSNVLLTNVPVSAERTVKVQATDGDVAEATDSRTLKAENGQELGKTEVTYAVNRKTLEAAGEHPDDWQVTPHNGLTISWPIGAEKKDYSAWVNETQATIPVKFVKEEDKGGVKTYVYQAESAAAPIKDTQVLDALPKALPSTALAGLAARLPLPDATKAALARALPSLGGTVPLSYTYQVTSTFWVEPTTGIVIDNQRQEVREATPGAAPLAVPIYDVSSAFSEQSVKDAAADATDSRDSIQLYSKTLPLILLVLGLLALLGGLLGWFTRKRRAAVVRSE